MKDKNKSKNKVFFDENDPYLKEIYNSINDSKMQQKIRELKPFPVTVVYWQKKNHSAEEVKEHFELMDELGFTGLKGLHVRPNSDVETSEIKKMAVEAGISPWFYGMAGWERIDDELLEKLGISQDLSREEIQKHPKMLEYQKEYYLKRIENEEEKPGLGEPRSTGLPVSEELIPRFAGWLEDKYGTLQNLQKEWNEHLVSRDEINTFASFKEAARVAGTGKDLEEKSLGHWDFKRIRDALRFMADEHADRVEKAVQRHQKYDPEEPIRTGNHMLFYNQAAHGWDLETQARAMREGGSFYNSIHLVHHFGEVEGEVERPVYMQARMTQDFFKGGWSATWESTGGPAIYSGHSGAGVDQGMITKLMLNYVAAGLKGIGFWSWTAREAGHELGEYALTDMDGDPCPRTKRAGKIARRLQKYRFELWESSNEPMVGIMYNWDNEAIYAAMSYGGYPVDRQEEIPKYPVRARIGASRALINNNVPFEYVTPNDLDKGLAGRYQVLYLPHISGLSLDTMKLLAEYVKKGGRVVADMPCLMFDNKARLAGREIREVFQEIFGFKIADFQIASNLSLNLEGRELEGQFADLKDVQAKVLSSFENGKPAILSRKKGQGTAAFMNFAASRMCKKPGNKFMEEIISEVVSGENETDWSCELPMVYRLSGEKADHYFFINDGFRKKTVLNVKRDYKQALDVIKDKEVEIKEGYIPVKVPAHSGLWLRLEK